MEAPERRTGRSFPRLFKKVEGFLSNRVHIFVRASQQVCCCNQMKLMMLVRRLEVSTHSMNRAELSSFPTLTTPEELVSPENSWPNWTVRSLAYLCKPRIPKFSGAFRVHSLQLWKSWFWRLLEGEQPGTSSQYFSARCLCMFMWSSKLRRLLLNCGPLQDSHWQRLHLIEDRRASKSAHEKPSLKQHLLKHQQRNKWSIAVFCVKWCNHTSGRDQGL